MKKLFALFLIISIAAFSLCGCFNSTAETKTNENSSTTSDVSSEETRITEEEAIEIASEHWGIKSGDKDETTGFSFLIIPVESGNDNIRVDLKWLVNDSTYSTVDTVEIDSITGEIVGGYEESNTDSTRITEEEAIEIASEHWGIKSGDKDETTGFSFLIIPVESGNDNIRVDLKWLVNGTNYSTVDTIEIDPFTGEVLPYEAQ